METIPADFDPPGLRRMSRGLYLCEDICNVYLIVRGKRAIMIDSGSGLAAATLASLGIDRVDWVLHTHFHRDQCDGAGRLAALGARIGAPAGELAYFAATEFWQTRNIFDNYDTYNDFAAPLSRINVDHALVDYETFAWEDVKLQVVPAPGHTKGSIALVGEIDGRRIGFSGDAIHHSGRPWTLFDLEWGYGVQDGVAALSLSLKTLAGLSLDVIFPSHGDPLTTPSAACGALLARLDGYHQWLAFSNVLEPMSGAPLPSGGDVQSLTPHLWMNTGSFANTYAVVTDEGRALFLDYGFPSYAHFSANQRFVEHSLDQLRTLAGLKVIDAVMPSHYHDDHVCGLQYLCEHHGARLWVFENQEDLLAHPEAYKIPGLWRRPMVPSRVFADGETFRWEGISFTAAKTPGHTEYACAIAFELDGRRIVHAGDTIGRGVGGVTLRGPVFQNGFNPGDFLASVTRLREFEPDFILTGHWGALPVDGPLLDEALRRARLLNDVMWDLIAVPEAAGFSFDPNWATLYPYQMTLVADEPTPIEVRIVNHLSTNAVATASLRLPAGWICDPPDGEVTIARSGRAALPFLVTAPPRAEGEERHMIAAEITLNGRSYGPVAEGIAVLG